MQKAGTKIDFRRDKVTVFGKEQDLHFTTSAHYCVPLNHHCEINSDISKFNQERTILFTNNLGTKSVKERKDVALKLHKQFSHPRRHKLKKLLIDGGVDDKEFFDMIENIEKHCTVCTKYKCPPAKPIVTFPLASEFNDFI